ncbi:39S ribosomal protein L20, mitochondrial [Nilaparvata lugens]|uniref:39S ribosomal protein L20, mitochondrial n=1 Tax=Nilaparvata lugens TaxID=108931 RepID=UPI000B98E0A4|nr:39S ribosomal protein L20, mitochondrial [Nilaparvata lugens]
MVFTSIAHFIRANINKMKGPDEFWRKRRIFRLTAHFINRKRNCYSLAIRGAHRAMQYATKGRHLKKQDMRNLWLQRVTAGSEEHGVPFPVLQKGLIRSDVLLSQKTLSELAAWEPRTFKALTQLAWTKGVEDGFNRIETLGEPPKNVFTRGMLTKEVYLSDDESKN